jgi:hypothetical protein
LLHVGDGNGSVAFASGGVLPNIRSLLLPKKSKKEKGAA